MSSPMLPFESQDKNDDDGQVIDSFLIETSAPPNLADALEPIVIPTPVEVPRTTRLFSKDILFDPSWNATLILPADHTRKSLNVYVYSPDAVVTDGVRLCDEKGSMLTTAGKLLHGGTIDLHHHTGALYAIPVGAAADGAASAPVSLQYWGVAL